MRFKLQFLLSVAFASCTLSAANAETIKVGVVAPFSGPYAVFGKQIREGVEAYQKENGTTLNGNTVEVIYRDLDGPNPPRAKALAQELIVKEKVQYLGGTIFTPNAMAIAPLADEAKVPYVIFNAAKTGLTAKFPFTLRTSYNLSQVTFPAADYTLERGRKKVVTLVSDYAAGIDAETAFKQRFEAGGGKVLETIRIPMKTTDFTPFLQKAKALSPDSLYVFMGGGLPSFGFIKSYAENGLKKSGIHFIGTGETDETNLQSLGEAALGIETSLNYSSDHRSEKNYAFKAALKKVNPEAVSNVVTASAYDGMHVIYQMIKATAGTRDGMKALAAVKGMAWESPRGPVKLDPESRDIVQNVYIREVVRDASNILQNKELKTFGMQPTYVTR
jgi:branched-chain amino acid transport system substrate-binding protein